MRSRTRRLSECLAARRVYASGSRAIDLHRGPSAVPHSAHGVRPRAAGRWSQPRPFQVALDGSRRVRIGTPSAPMRSASPRCPGLDSFASTASPQRRSPVNQDGAEPAQRPGTSPIPAAGAAAPRIRRARAPRAPRRPLSRSAGGRRARDPSRGPPAPTPAAPRAQCSDALPSCGIRRP